MGFVFTLRPIDSMEVGNSTLNMACEIDILSLVSQQIRYPSYVRSFIKSRQLSIDKIIYVVGQAEVDVGIVHSG